MLASATLVSLAWNSYLVGGLTLAFLVVCVIMLLTILIQKPQGGGLSAAFGASASSGQTAFGAKTGDALTIFTIFIFVVYLGFAVVLNWAARPTPTAGEPVLSDPTSPTAPGTTPAPATAPAATLPADAPATPADGAAVQPETLPTAPPSEPLPASTPTPNPVEPPPPGR